MVLSVEEGCLRACENGKKYVTSSCFTAGLAEFSHKELVAMNHVLITIPQARDFLDILDIIYTALKDISLVYACACYWMIENGLGLHLTSGIGECKSFLPDVIPHGSDLFESIALRDNTNRNAFRTVQPSLFGDDPTPIFYPIVYNNRLVGALALVHGSPDHRFLCTLLGEAASTIELLCSTGYDLLRNSRFANQQISVNSEAVSKDESVEKSEIEQYHNKLTAREKEVLHLLTEGMSTKEIAEKLYISKSTCKHHIENILTKLHVHSRTAAVAVGFARLGSNG